MKQEIIILGFSSRWQDWILFKRDHNPHGFSSWHQEMDKYFTTKNRHAKYNSEAQLLPEINSGSECIRCSMRCAEMTVIFVTGDCRFPQSQLQLGTDQNRPTQFHWWNSMVQPHHPNFWKKGHQKDTDKKFNLETASLAQLLLCQILSRCNP